MPLTEEQRRQYQDPTRLLGTWWYYLPNPMGPQLLQVVETIYEGGTDHLVFRLVQWVNGLPTLNQETRLVMPAQLAGGLFSGLWLLGDGGWIFVFLRAGQEVINAIGERATISEFRPEDLVVLYGGDTGPGSGFMGEADLYEFMHTWYPAELAPRNQAQDGDRETTIHVEIPGYAVESPPRSRFERFDDE